MRRTVAILASLGCVLALSSCAFGTARFTLDTRLKIIGPSNGSSIGLPFTLQLRVTDLDVGTPGSGHKYFVGAFVDRAPIRPGDSLLAVVDHQCKRSGNGCANLTYFAEHNVVLTGDTSVPISAVPQTATHRKAEAVHTINVVLIDNQTNRRVGETLAVTRFRVKAAA